MNNPLNDVSNFINALEEIFDKLKTLITSCADVIEESEQKRELTNQ